MVHSRLFLKLGLLVLPVFLHAGAAAAIDVAAEDPAKPPALRRAYVAEELAVEPTLDMLDAARAAARPGLADFFARHGSSWEVRWDLRSERPNLIQGQGIALLPGRGNRLTPAEVGLAAGDSPSLELVERRLRQFLAEGADVLGVAGFDLRLDPSRSTAFGEGATHWFVEFAQYHDGVKVEGAAVFFRIAAGNIVQFGAERISPVALEGRSVFDREEAFRAMWSELDLRSGAEIREVVERGELLFIPAAPQGEVRGELFAGVPGLGYEHRRVWRFVFRLVGEDSTYEVLFDDLLGSVLQVRDLTVTATIQGGIYPNTNTDPEVLRPMPFLAVTNGTPKVTDAAGVYTYSGGTATSTLNGQYFQMSDACGAISLSDAATGNLNFGTSGGTDCTTPGVGGAGNTHASRSGFYHLTRINRKADTFFPANAWLDTKVVSNMNINLTCNAFWNGATLNFYRSGGGCSNTGELAGVFLHEWGHGFDQFTGGTASEYGSGEAVGDTFAFLETQDSCIGQNFLPGINCQNCTACTGVRDVGDFSGTGPAAIARPSQVTNNTGINCDAWTCPYLYQGVTPYQGPMGYEGHCESYIASSANWDLTQLLLAEHGGVGWSTMDDIWYGSLTPSKSAYRLVSGGTCNPAAVVDGCAATNWYTVYLAVDDDDGNLANGTPNGCRIHTAFNTHGIACGAAPACSCVPLVVAAAGNDATICPGGSTTIGTPGLPGHTYLWSPGGATTAQVLVSPGSTTVYTVTATTSCGSTQDSVTVTVNGATADAGPNHLGCPGSPVQIGTPAVAGHTYLWSPGGATTAQITVSPTSNTDYTVTATNACQSVQDTVSVNVFNVPPAVANAGPDGAICSGDSIQLGTPPVAGLFYYWTPGDLQTAQITVSPTVDTTYTLEVSNICGFDEDTVNVDVTQAPVPPGLLSPADGSVDVALPVILDWSDSANTSGYTVEVALDAAFATIVASGPTASSTFAVSGLTPVQHFWRVTASGSCNPNAQSVTFDFTVDDAIFDGGFESGNLLGWSTTSP